MYVPRRKMSQVLGFEVEEVENGAVDVFQVIAKHLTRVGCSLLEVTGEVQLRARRAFSRGLLQPVAAFPKILRAVQATPRILRPDEKAAAVICENDITRLAFAPPVDGRKVLQSKRLFSMKMHKSLYCGRKHGARYRVRTCDPYRVKVVLYH